MEEALQQNGMGGDPEKVPQPLPPKHQTPKGLTHPDEILRKREEQEHPSFSSPPPPDAPELLKAEVPDPASPVDHENDMPEPSDPENKAEVMEDAKYRELARELFPDNMEPAQAEPEPRRTTAGRTRAGSVSPPPPPATTKRPRRKLKKVEYYGSSSSSDEEEDSRKSRFVFGGGGGEEESGEEEEERRPYKKKRTHKQKEVPPLPSAPLNQALTNRKVDMHKAFANPFTTDAEQQDRDRHESMLMAKAFGNKVNDVKRRTLMRAIFGDE